VEGVAGAHDAGLDGNLLAGEAIRISGHAKPEWRELTKFDGRQFVYAGSGWLLTSDLDMAPALGGKSAGFRRAAFRFSSLAGEWRMDDLYVDPSRRI
jgi:hypothetical protein